MIEICELNFSKISKTGIVAHDHLIIKHGKMPHRLVDRFAYSKFFSCFCLHFNMSDQLQ